MLKRLKNLIKLSAYEPKDNGEEVKLEPNNSMKPKGKAVIVDMTNPLDIFEEHD